MSPTGPPTTKEILKISRRTTDIIQRLITSDVCLFGSAAAYLWANTGRRVPNDIDILVNYDDAERIKQTIVDADNRYFLENSRFRNATHKKLYCRLPGFSLDGRCVKIDILVPGGDLGLPRILTCDTSLISDIPVMPIFTLLVMKTQGWWDHRTSPRNDFRAKVDGDIGDVDALLHCAGQEQVEYEEERGGPHTDEFMNRALLLAHKYVNVHNQRWKWLAIGFPL